MGIRSLGVVFTGHIWWEIPTCNEYDVMYGRKSQCALTMMSYLVGDPNHQWVMMSLPVIKLYKLPIPFLNTQIAKASRKTDHCATSQVEIHFKLFL